MKFLEFFVASRARKNRENVSDTRIIKFMIFQCLARGFLCAYDDGKKTSMKRQRKKRRKRWECLSSFFPPPLHRVALVDGMKLIEFRCSLQLATNMVNMAIPCTFDT